ncbi:hypothetical protein D0T49_00915 [Paludibacter sp. 221]|uniref:TonB-dependent receptor plug domain-containing protein n=1 Tax=Paludibacter sp. 221 TaxID=2302939 RepID=UPI0013D7BB86|nr:TonB-dependent receptor plug domain-containing protein [Paludibacter sp. 221]NDV45615.1 hypothetical protein [Paludibacter sp. 221]
MKQYILLLLVSLLPVSVAFAQAVETVDVRLQADSVIERSYDIQEITVEQSRKGAKITGISSGKITLHTDGVKSLPSILGNVDMLKVLELTPGVQTTGEGKSNIHIRGGDPGQTLLLYDNVPIYSPGHLLNIFPLFNSDHLSAVELVKGGVDSKYSNLLSGTIKSLPKEQVPQKNSIRGNVGLISAQATADIKFNDKYGMYLSGRKTYLNLLLQPFLDATFNRSVENKIEDLKYDFDDVNLTFVGRLSAKNKLVVNAFFGRDKLRLIEDNINMNGLLNWSNLLVSAKLETRFNDELRLEQQLFYTGFKNDFSVSVSEMSIKTFSEIQRIAYQGSMNYSLWSVPFATGVKYQYNELYPQDFETLTSDFAFPDISFGRNDAHNITAFLSARLNLIPRLTLEPGLQYNFFVSRIDKLATQKDFHHVDFRLFGKYNINDEQFLRGTLSHNSQHVIKLFPSNSGLPTDFWVAASSEIKPQYSNEFSLGYYRTLSDGMFEFSADVYFRTMKNLVEYNQNFIEVDNEMFSRRVFTGNGKAYGVEFMVKKNYGKFTGWLSYSLGRSERKFADIDDGQVFPAKHDRTHDLSFAGTYVFNDKWDVSLIHVLATGNAYTSPTSWYFVNNMPVKEYGKYNNARLPVYNRTDVGLNYWFKKDNGINISIYDVFAVHNPMYVSLQVKQVEGTNDVKVLMKKRTLFTIIPSISWKFKF